MGECLWDVSVGLASFPSGVLPSYDVEHLAAGVYFTMMWSIALFGDGEAQRSAMEAAREGLALMEEQLKDKRFFGGDDAIGLADIAGGGLLAHWLSVLEEVAGVSVLASGSDEELPALRRWAAEYRSSEAVRACLPDRARLLCILRRRQGQVRLCGQSDDAKMNIKI